MKSSTTGRSADTFRRSFGGTSTVFACGICRRNTRRTNQGNSHLCPQCDEWSMQENGINDGNYVNDPAGLAHAEAVILRLKLESAAKGGDRARLGLPAEVSK